MGIEGDYNPSEEDIYDEEVSKQFSLIKGLFDTYDNLRRFGDFTDDDPRIVEAHLAAETQLDKLKSMVPPNKFHSLGVTLDVYRRRYEHMESTPSIDGKLIHEGEIDE